MPANSQFLKSMRKRRRVAVVELISKGSPRILFAGPGNVYSISPKVRKVADLKDHQCGVKRLISAVDVDSSETDTLISIQKQIETGKTFNTKEEGRQWLSYIVTELMK